jgi:hypothetical protein
MGALALSGRAIERDRLRLSTTEAWATWMLTEDEFRRFVRTERRRIGILSLGLLAFGVAISACMFALSRNLWIGIGMVAMFLFLSTILFVVEVPPLRAGGAAREVRIGERGIDAMGHYTPLGQSSRNLLAVGLRPGNPDVLVFRIRGYNAHGHKNAHEVRVPVPGAHLEEAKAIVERFAPQPPKGMSYPDLLKWEREQRMGQT